MSPTFRTLVAGHALVAIVAAILAAVLTPPGHADKPDDFPKFTQVSDGFEEVVSTADGSKPFYRVWHRKKDAQLLAELPKEYEKQKFFVVPTVAGGDTELGVYSIWHTMVGADAAYLYWIRYDKKLALIAPNLAQRASGDAESKLATKRVFTDRVVLTTPIVAMGPGGGPVIDLDQVLVQQSGKFFGRFTRGANLGLTKVVSAKAFPRNIELTFSVPRVTGQLAQIHYSIGAPTPTEGYKPREADRRVGFYYVNFVDRSKYEDTSPTQRYINRWHVEKADPKLRLSPPKRPIVYYIEHTTPIRYRRWVRDGILAWNRAFEQVGIINAIEVRQQDATTGAHMDKDPEDLRYSFVRWTNSDMGFAIGPVHSNPETGEIYEADIVMDENFLRSWRTEHLDTELAASAMSALDEDLAAWLTENPRWDPRYRFARAADRPAVLRYQRALADGTAAELEAPPTMTPAVWHVHRDGLGLPAHTCMYRHGMTFGVSMMHTALATELLPLVRGEDGAAGEDESMIDGLPESFVGPLLKDVIMHEVGHTMGLMHNWKGSAAYSFADINSDKLRGKIPLSGTVMDYTPANIVVEEDGLVQGDYQPIDIGPYDLWAIEWGYTTGDPAPIARCAAQPGLAFSAEEGQSGPDPQAKVWEIGENTIDQSEAIMRFVEVARAKIIDKGVDDNESWQRARTLYSRLLAFHFRSVATASNWIGGAYVNKYRKGDPGATDPVRPVEVDRQRRALAFIIENALRDDVFGLDPELLSKLTADQWYDEGYTTAPDLALHDRISGIQASALSLLMNPTRLRRIQDNELRVPAEDDALTIPEVLHAVRDAVWAEPATPATDEGYTARRPMLSSLERNLQREHLDRMIDLSTGMSWPNASGAAIATLARHELREIRDRVAEWEERGSADAYTVAHLADVRERIAAALKAQYLLR